MSIRRRLRIEQRKALELMVEHGSLDAFNCAKLGGISMIRILTRNKLAMRGADLKYQITLAGRLALSGGYYAHQGHRLDMPTAKVHPALAPFMGGASA